MIIPVIHILQAPLATGCDYALVIVLKLHGCFHFNCTKFQHQFLFSCFEYVGI